MRAYLKLVRFPNVFTAWADVWAGYLLAGLAWGGERWWPLAWLVLASTGFYLAGMAFNDIADREADCRTRPSRPLAARTLTWRGALLCACGLLLAGLLSAAFAGRCSFYYGVAIACCLLLYDFGRPYLAGSAPFVLGACRFLNVQLGLSSHPDFPDALAQWAHFPVVYAPAITIGLYATGLTFFSAQEETGRRGWRLGAGWLSILAGGASAGWAAHGWIWAPFAVVAALLGWFTWRAQREATPCAARQLVFAGVLALCWLDGGWILGHGGSSAWLWACPCFLLPLPAWLAARWLAQAEA